MVSMSGGLPSQSAPSLLATRHAARPDEGATHTDAPLPLHSPSVLSALVPSMVAAKPVDWEESPLFRSL